MGRCGVKWSSCPVPPGFSHSASLMSAETLNPKLYTGEFRHGVDPKHRITIPSAWRSKDGDEFFMRLDSAKKCISVMPVEEFRAKVALIETAPGISLRERQIMKRHFAAKSQACTADKQGRMVIPQDLASLVGVKEEAMLVGAVGSFEIWSPEGWTETTAADDATCLNLENLLGL